MLKIVSTGVTIDDEVINPGREAERFSSIVVEESWSVAAHVITVWGEVLDEILLGYAACIIHAVDSVVDFKENGSAVWECVNIQPLSGDEREKSDWYS